MQWRTHRSTRCASRPSTAALSLDEAYRATILLRFYDGLARPPVAPWLVTTSSIGGAATAGCRRWIVTPRWPARRLEPDRALDVGAIVLPAGQ